MQAEDVSCIASWKTAAKWCGRLACVCGMSCLTDVALYSSKHHWSKCVADQSDSDSLAKVAIFVRNYHLALTAVYTYAYIFCCFAVHRASKGWPLLDGVKPFHIVLPTAAYWTTFLGQYAEYVHPSFCWSGSSAWFLSWLWLAPWIKLAGLIIFGAWFGHALVCLVCYISCWVIGKIRSRQQSGTVAAVCGDCKNCEKVVVADPV